MGSSFAWSIFILKRSRPWARMWSTMAISIKDFLERESRVWKFSEGSIVMEAAEKISVSRFILLFWTKELAVKKLCIFLSLNS